LTSVSKIRKKSGSTPKIEEEVFDSFFPEAGNYTKTDPLPLKNYEVFILIGPKMERVSITATKVFVPLSNTNLHCLEFSNNGKTVAIFREWTYFKEVSN
jgi:hypothetical protein